MRPRQPPSTPLFLSLTLRTLQFLSSLIILALYSYFLATLTNSPLPTSPSLRAVEGISGISTLYTILAILSLCCLPKLSPFVSLTSMVLDVAFAASFIYVATVNKFGARSCSSGEVDTPFGRGDVGTGKGEGDVVGPGLGVGCRMGSACLACAIILIFLFLLSVGAEYFMIRHQRREARYRPSPLGAVEGSAEGDGKKQGWFSRLFGRGKKTGIAGDGYNPNALPEHVTPNDVRGSYATEQTRVGTSNGPEAPKYEGMGYVGHGIGGQETGWGREDDIGGQNAGWGRENEMGAYESGRADDLGGYNPPRTNVTPGREGYDAGGFNPARTNTALRREGYDDVPLAQFPHGNYQYSDGVYDRV